jgi:protein polybromo-1
MLSILRQHPDIFVESLTGNGAVFTINERLVEYSEDDDEPAGPARKPTTRAKPKKSYADPDDDDFDDHDAVSPGERHGSKRKREEPHYDGMSPQQTDACKSILKKVKEMKDRDGRQVAELFILLPTRKQLPDYYKQIAHPIDFDSIGKCLNKQGGYQTVWKFLLACELMLSNAQVYNEEHSELWEDAATLRKAFIAELNKVYPGHPFPEPMSVYDEEECQEPEWNPPAKMSGGMKVVVKAGGGGAEGLKVKMHNAGKGDALKITMKPVEPMPAFEDCGKCANCTTGRKSRANRCLEVQMKEQVHLGHEGAKIASKGTGAKGLKLEIYWPGDDSFYSGLVMGYDAVKLEHTIKYDAEGEEEQIALWGPDEVVKVKGSRR